MNLPEVTAPQVHLNGSGFTNLMLPLEDTARIIQDAIEKLAWARPHRRDYYWLLDGEDRYKLAVIQHEARLALLAEVQRSISMELEMIQEQKEERAAHA